MSFIPALSANEVATVTAALSVTIGFAVYWFVSISKKLEDKFSKRYGENYSARWVVVQRLVGFTFLGILPGIAMYCFAGLTPSDLGFKATFHLESLWWILGMGAILAPMNILNARKPQSLAMYPQIRVKEWSPTLVVVSAITWLMYLLAYEFLFRGVLFMGTHDHIGVWPAIALNVCIYSAVHIPKGIGEAVGAIPFGTLICLVTLSTGDIWVAFLAHGVLALSNEWASLYHHPDMKVRRK